MRDPERASLLDAEAGVLHANHRIRIEGEYILAVGGGVPAPSGPPEIALDDRVAMPGKIGADMHVVAETFNQWGN